MDDHSDEDLEESARFVLQLLSLPLLVVAVLLWYRYGEEHPVVCWGGVIAAIGLLAFSVFEWLRRQDEAEKQGS